MSWFIYRPTVWLMVRFPPYLMKPLFNTLRKLLWIKQAMGLWPWKKTLIVLRPSPKQKATCCVSFAHNRCRWPRRRRPSPSSVLCIPESYNGLVFIQILENDLKQPFSSSCPKRIGSWGRSGLEGLHHQLLS